MKRIALVLTFSMILSFSYSQNADYMKAERYYGFQKYELALKYYLKYYSQDSTNFDLNVRIADLYLSTNIDKSRALLYYLRAKIINPNAPKSLSFNIARAYYFDYKFENAIQLLSEYSNEAKDMKDKKKAGHFLQLVLAADALYNLPIKAEIIYLGDKINSPRADLNPFINSDENKLFFSSRREKNLANIFYSDYDTITGQWGEPIKIDDVSSYYEDILAGIEQDGNEIFIHYLDDSPNVDLLNSKNNGKFFTEPIITGSLISSEHKEEGAFVTSDGNNLFYASAKEDGFGGLDLYISTKLPNGDWGLPISLGDKINSNQDENYPFLTPDGSKLYYSSKGFNTMGGYDLFVSIKNSLGEWSYPTNIGYPVNDVYDNKNISFPRNMRYAYTNYVKPFKGAGNFDFYKIIFKEREPDFLTFIGFVYYGNSNDKKLVTLLDTDMSINIYERKSDELVGTYTLNEKNAKLVIALLPGDYTLVIESASYHTYKENIKVKEETLRKDLIFKDFILKPKS